MDDWSVKGGFVHNIDIFEIINIIIIIMINIVPKWLWACVSLSSTEAVSSPLTLFSDRKELRCQEMEEQPERGRISSMMIDLTGFQPLLQC